MKYSSIRLLLVSSFMILTLSSQNPCPVENNVGSIFTGQVIVGERGGFVPLIDGQDTQCYNYSLQFTFWRVPDVAVSVYDFEAQKTENLHYFIKPLYTKSLSFVPFIIHTSWPYTRWARISFSFLAEDRSDFQAGYYQIDSGMLGSCLNGKVTHVLLPFRSHFSYNQKIHHHVFLHGFEINTQRITESTRSPFEVQLTIQNINSTGIALTLSVTTITQVNFLYVSYLVYQETTLQIRAGQYIYEGQSDLVHIPPVLIGRNYARIHGFTGFVINYNYQEFILSAQWTGADFIFNVGTNKNLIQYLGYQYIFFSGSNCADCPGYPITYNNTCVRHCPPNTYLTPEKICLSCGEGRTWNGSTCIKSCPQGQYLNSTTNQCQCPQSMSWNGQTCITCTQGKVFNATSNTCDCPYPLRWNGFICARIPECTGGKQWNVYSYSCECPSHLIERSGKCVQIPRCLNGQILKNNKCVCPPKTYWNGKSCAFTNCVGSQIWNGVKCVCKSGFYFNGQTCIECINGQVWNNDTRVCECEDGYKWNGNYCQKVRRCSGGRIWNSTYEQCICPQNHFWAGNHCKLQPKCCCGQTYSKKTDSCACVGKAKWNGTACVRCTNGKLWDQPSRKCVCPPGTKWENNFCSVIISCGGGMIWNQNTWSCECPSSTVWNGHFCISNPCSKGRIWNESYKSCQCPENKIWQNQACIPPKILCTNGQYWDPTIYACACPPGTFPSINSCDPIPVCHGDQIYNPYNNKCECPYGLQLSGRKCVPPSCPGDLVWNGYKCVVINCPPLTVYKNGQCQDSEVPKDSCLKWQYWNGKKCQYFPKSCPLSTNWNGTHCSPVGNSCPQGYYKGQSSHCDPFPQLCIPPTVWNGHSCDIISNSCPEKTFFNGSTCMPYVKCQNGKVWNPSYLQCACADGTQNNGEICVSCSNEKIWIPGEGCQCPEGKFDFGSKCEIANYQKCENIPNSKWKDGLCICKPGFVVEGLQCVCKGLDKGSHCERCAHKPHSQWGNNQCRCDDDYTDVYGRCVPNSNPSGNDNPSDCSAGAYFDSHQRKCLPCPDGCISCDNCYTCKQCLPEFSYYRPAKICIEYCGDGKRFVSECDDGNNKDGDGCSLDCKVEQGYVCTGGSPNNKDSCRTFQPSEVSISQSGQIRLPQSIILNIRINYLPKELLQSFDCNNECENVLIGEILDGDKSPTSMKSSYISGSSFAFSFEINFERTYIGKFTIRIKINPVIAMKYYGGVFSGQIIQIQVDPAHLATQQEDQLS